jgi:hypothetical protein
MRHRKSNGKMVEKQVYLAPANLPVGFVPAQGTVERAPAATTVNLRSIAKALFWWQSPEESLANPQRFLAQVMTLGTWHELQAVKKLYHWDAFRDALLNAEAGWFDARSWALWHHAFGMIVRPMPKRSLT